MEMIEALQAEIAGLKTVLQNANAEKVAIDQVAMQNIKENVSLRTQLILLQEQIDKKDRNIAELKATITAYEEAATPTCLDTPACLDAA